MLRSGPILQEPRGLDVPERGADDDGDFMKTCLVTGASGFLGRRVVEEFAAAGYRVVGIGRGPALGHGEHASGLSAYTRMDLPASALEAVMAAERPDVVIHAAGPASVADSIARPLRDFLGTVGTLAGLLDCVREHCPTARVVILSSAAVYGNPEHLPLSEDSAIAPVSPYGFHKVIAETLLREYHSVYGVRSCAARVFSAYGSGLRRQIFWDVCEKATAGSVRLFGTGNESRDFIQADDVALATRVLAENAVMNGEAYNVASGVETTVRSLAEQLIASLPKRVTVEFSGIERPGDPLRWRADISALSALGFTPRVALAEGVAGYCAWYKEMMV